jgi:hypothetical protein
MGSTNIDNVCARGSFSPFDRFPSVNHDAVMDLYAIGFTRYYHAKHAVELPQKLDSEKNDD